MELHQLRYFEAVARTKNFTRAAKSLNIAQPALSQQIKKLENELGLPLFNRGKRLSRLTQAGEAVLEKALLILGLVDQLRDSASKFQELKRGTLRIGALPALSAAWLPAVIKAFLKVYPQVDMILKEDTSTAIAHWVTAGEVDLGLGQLPVSQEHFHSVPLFSEGFCLLARDDSPLTQKDSLFLKTLSETPIVLYKGQVRTETLSACRRAGFEPKVVCETAEIATAIALVQTGLGVAILPESGSLPPREGVRRLTIKDRQLRRQIGLIIRQNASLSFIAQEFIRIAKQVSELRKKASQ